jgi:Fe-S cluster biogenesis protein NfuA
MSEDKKPIEEEIKKSLEKIRPQLQADGGDVQFVEYDPETQVVKVSLTGMCATCPMAQMTLKQGIEQQIRQDVDKVSEVIAV